MRKLRPQSEMVCLWNQTAHYWQRSNHRPLVSLIIMCLAVFLLGFILLGTLYFLDLCDYFLFHVREVFSYYLRPFLSLFSFWDSYNANVGAFDVVPEVS